MARVVDPIFVEDECVRQSADLQQPMPIRRTACQTGDFQTHDHTHAAQPNLRHKALESITTGGRGAGQAQIFIDHDNLVSRPSKGLCPSLQIVLPRSALTVLMYLPQRRLTNIEIRQSPQMFGRHFG